VNPLQSVTSASTNDLIDASDGRNDAAISAPSGEVDE
jgi:hypothetical protein